MLQVTGQIILVVLFWGAQPVMNVTTYPDMNSCTAVKKAVDKFYSGDPPLPFYPPPPITICGQQAPSALVPQTSSNPNDQPGWQNKPQK